MKRPKIARGEGTWSGWMSVMAMQLRRDCSIVERSQVMMRLSEENDLSADAVVTGWQDAMRTISDANGKYDLLQFFIVPIRVLGRSR